MLLSFSLSLIRESEYFSLSSLRVASICYFLSDFEFDASFKIKREVDSFLCIYNLVDDIGLAGVLTSLGFHTYLTSSFYCN